MTTEISPELISIISDTIIAFCAVATVTIAFLGLKTWQAEMKGKAKYELARQILRNVYSYKEEMRRGRFPIITSAEFPTGYNMISPTREEEASAYREVFNRRLEPIGKMCSQLKLDAIEASVLWGPEIKKEMDKLQFYARKLQIAFQNHLQGIRKNWADSPRFSTQYDKNLEIIYSSSDDETLDKIDEGIEKNIKNIEEMLVPILGRKLISKK